LRGMSECMPERGDSGKVAGAGDRSLVAGGWMLPMA